MNFHVINIERAVDKIQDKILTIGIQNPLSKLTRNFQVRKPITFAANAHIQGFQALPISDVSPMFPPSDRDYYWDKLDKTMNCMFAHVNKTGF